MPHVENRNCCTRSSWVIYRHRPPAYPRNGYHLYRGTIDQPCATAKLNLAEQQALTVRLQVKRLQPQWTACFRSVALDRISVFSVTEELRTSARADRENHMQHESCTRQAHTSTACMCLVSSTVQVGALLSLGAEILKITPLQIRAMDPQTCHANRHPHEARVRCLLGNSSLKSFLTQQTKRLRMLPLKPRC